MKIINFQKILKEKNIDLAFLTHKDPNLFYFLEQDISHGFLMVTPSFAKLYISSLDKLKPVSNISQHPFPKDWKQEFKDDKKLDIGICKQSISLKTFETLNEIFQNATFKDISNDLNGLKLIKSPTELSKMRMAAKIADTALTLFLKKFEESQTMFQTELDVALFLEAKIKRQGADLSFPTIVATAQNSAVPHHKTGTTKLKPGFLLIDFGAKWEGYCSDMTRMFYLGNPSKQEQENYDLLLNCQLSCVKTAKIGVKCQDLDKLAKNLLQDKAKYFIHSLGHGIGTQVHENPRLSQNSKDLIQLNTPFTIEPGIYFEGQYGLRIEDTCVIVDDKISKTQPNDKQNFKLERLTNSPKDLILLPINKK